MANCRRTHIAGFAAVMILALPATSLAQGTGTISSAVTDSTGAFLPGSGSKNLQLRVELFNVLNRSNFGIPSQSLFAANGTRLADAGRITTLASAPLRGRRRSV
jgi:hypothetical protein